MSSNKLLLKFALRHPLLIVITAILGFSGALFNGISTALIVPLLLGFLGQDTEVLKKGPQFLKTIIEFFDLFPGDWKFIAMIVVIVLAIILKNAASYATSLSSNYLARSLVRGMRLEGVRLLLDVDLDFYSKQKIGTLINYMNQEIARTAAAIGVGIKVFSAGITILVFVWILLSLSWQLTIISTFLLCLVALTNQIWVRRAKKFGRILSQRSGDYSNKLLEILTGIRLIKTVSNEESEYQRLAQYIQEREKADLQSQANYSAVAPINEVSGILTVIIIVVIGRYLFAEQLESVSTILLIYLVTLFRMIPIIGQLNGARSRFANTAPSAELVADFLNRSNKPIMESGSKPFTGLKEGIQFNGVNFHYPSSEEEVLQDINLWVPKGKTVALVGSSGAGKTTLVDLVPRFYDPTEGEIKIDGVNVKDFELSTLRRAMGIVSQDTFLFNTTVRNNIAYGWEETTDEEIIEAAKRANAYDFIMQLSEGFNTEIGDRGVMLSGGQRQRIAIARALLRNPQILILDEATSALDTVSERLVQEAINELCRDRTTLVIAHRLSTVRQAYKIAVMEKGRIVELGSHDELLELDGHYAELHEMQFGKKKAKKVTLPSNAALIRASIRASHELRTRLSYEVRTRLNAMLGSLQLVTDNLVDTPEEQEELIQESYEAAISLLKTLSFFEENGAQFPAEK
ncbi:ATP-binding cassette domain-containing protein [Spirulina sp. CS-785/01]|uniref:ABC transporter ATP-binding protein n=1 Tax=Spirulina sp. CS-785/01 TaxID=3021716 RepID=UPI00232EA8D0|nr:ATP-binding cassette domain-containing protein [Spirulina sp. CS-785/01]MDB9312347.1 ATP-binding cassette domain-containing protein [Spirulina sp. CS-785/01]